MGIIKSFLDMGFFTDEVALNAQKEKEKQLQNAQKEKESKILKAQDSLLSNFLNRTSTTYIDDEFIDLGKIDYIEVFDDNYYLTRIYAIANQASSKKGFTPYYYQEIGGKRIKDIAKWKLEEKVYSDENATGFIVLGDSVNNLTLVRKDTEHKTKVEAERKKQRNKENEQFIKTILAMEANEFDVQTDTILYANFDGFEFNASGYKNENGMVNDKIREYIILNQASEKSGFKPCYYQEQNGNLVFDTEKWQLGKWNGQWEKSDTIKQDESKNGFYYSDNYILRKDPQTINEVEKKKFTAVKAYFEKISSKGSICENNSIVTYMIPLDESYNKNTNTFALKDLSSDKLWTISQPDFLYKLKEITGQDYTITSAELTRNPTNEERSEYKNLKDKSTTEAIKSYYENISVNAKTEENNKTFVVKIPLDTSYNTSKKAFDLKDSSGKIWTIPQSDFLNKLKDITDYDYTIASSTLYREATKDDKVLYAFKNGNLHTNLVCNVKGTWICSTEVKESGEGLTVKSFKIKKSVFETKGLKTKDIIKNIILVDGSGKEREINFNDISSVQAPAKLILTVTRGKGKKAEELKIEIPVEWNENESNLFL